MSKIAVVGGTGSMGRVIVRDLMETAHGHEIIVIGRDKKRIANALKSYRKKNVLGRLGDASHSKALARALKGCKVCINAAQYELNVNVMRACIKAKCHYLDLGGLFHMTRRQLKLHGTFKRAGLLGILGMGAAPGITNMLAWEASKKLDTVERVHIRVGGRDFTKAGNEVPLVFAYSIQTLLEEHSKKPMVFERGKFKEVLPRTGMESYAFPAPIGRLKALHTLHSEVATLPVSLKKKGIRACNFKIAFSEDFEQKVGALAELGFASLEPIKTRGIYITPMEFSVKVLSRLPKPKTCPVDVEVLRAEVIGKRKKKQVRVLADAWAHSSPKWCFYAGDVDTGYPISIAAQMVADDLICAAGVFPPELIVPAKPFFRELKERGIRVSMRVGRA
ncbi:MAG: saccharopine dehydrogenase NADP-binding domain-containing protein [Candidatus Diapherotrites archaeon]|nr:saccharopine dehydrogenase NADP-binding domain-containing protein [Candidatus Diapherotrites archaeon]